jgi:hypothetical protein
MEGVVLSGELFGDGLAKSIGHRRFLRQYVDLWIRLQSVHLDEQSNDKFIWKWTVNQQYSASSAYRAFFLGQCSIPGAKELTRVQILPLDSSPGSRVGSGKTSMSWPAGR